MAQLNIEQAGNPLVLLYYYAVQLLYVFLKHYRLVLQLFLNSALFLSEFIKSCDMVSYLLLVVLCHIIDLPLVPLDHALLVLLPLRDGICDFLSTHLPTLTLLHLKVVV